MVNSDVCEILNGRHTVRSVKKLAEINVADEGLLGNVVNGEVWV